MKIALVHNKYQWPGGEDVIVEQERDLLRAAGHQVLEYSRSNHEIVNGTVIRQSNWPSEPFGRAIRFGSSAPYCNRKNPMLCTCTTPSS